MNKLVFLVLLVMSSSCAVAPVAPQFRQTSQFCGILDEVQHLGRCETSELICYVAPGGLNCFPKPKPVAAPEKAEPKKK